MPYGPTVASHEKETEPGKIECLFKLPDQGGSAGWDPYDPWAFAMAQVHFSISFIYIGSLRWDQKLTLWAKKTDEGGQERVEGKREESQEGCRETCVAQPEQKNEREKYLPLYYLLFFLQNYVLRLSFFFFFLCLG